ncbi:MAG: hypothetical protein QOF02_2251 [Blastocatellia bacterium]|jgi:hypothetical protein|nr:hypothetical protein [Blastocatellia bacterium]
MPFKFKDLIVTVVPRGRSGVAESGSGCAACSDAGSATVGSCTSECGMQCLDSGEVIELSPYNFIDPPYQLELRQLLIYGLAKSNVKVPIQNKVHVLEEQMRPQSLEEIEVLEKHIAGALRDLQEQKVKFQQRSK